MTPCILLKTLSFLPENLFNKVSHVFMWHSFIYEIKLLLQNLTFDIFISLCFYSEINT